MLLSRLGLKRWALIISTLLAVMALSFNVAIAQKEPRITDIVVTNTRDHLLVYFTVKDCFSPDITKAILSGIETSFTFFVRLYEPRDLWWDKTLSEVEVTHTIQYDSLKKVFKLHLPEREGGKVEVKDFEEAKSLMSEVVGLKVIRLDQLKKGERYQIQMMAELDKIKLPFHLHNILFFLSLWDFETPWYAVDFRY